jgi:hypothetical protein
MKMKIVADKTGVYLLKGQDKILAQTTDAYSKGYEDALNDGVKNNYFVESAYRHLYNMGYDAGIPQNNLD